MDKRIVKTRKAVFDALKRCLDDHPQELPTVKELCIEAKINKTTFYRNYRDMDDLVRSAIDDLAKRMLNEVNDVERLLDDPARVLYDLKRVQQKFRDELVYIDGNYLPVLEKCTERAILSRICGKNNADDYPSVAIGFVVGGIFHILAQRQWNDRTLTHLVSIVEKVAR